jgi:hypothetical protein
LFHLDLWEPQPPGRPRVGLADEFHGGGNDDRADDAGITDGNLVATVDLTEYDTTMTAWMGVSPDEVLPGHPGPLADPLGATVGK